LSSITNSDNQLTRLLKADDVAAAAQVSTERVWQLTREGKLPTVKLGPRTYRYLPERVNLVIREMEE
jgi:predicted DNA-binding transcriptional regulator AlpA